MFGIRIVKWAGPFNALAIKWPRGQHTQPKARPHVT